MLRLIGFILFMGGVVTTFENPSGESILSIAFGALLLFSMQPSLPILGVAIIFYSLFHAFNNRFSVFTLLGVAVGAAFILNRFSENSRTGGGSDGDGNDDCSGGDGGGGD